MKAKISLNQNVLQHDRLTETNHRTLEHDMRHRRRSGGCPRSGKWLCWFGNYYHRLGCLSCLPVLSCYALRNLKGDTAPDCSEWSLKCLFLKILSQGFSSAFHFWTESNGGKNLPTIPWEAQQVPAWVRHLVSCWFGCVKIKTCESDFLKYWALGKCTLFIRLNLLQENGQVRMLLGESPSLELEIKVRTVSKLFQ